jgi:adenylosuccinate synthase
MEFKGKRILVTGGSRGIGFGIAKAYLTRVGAGPFPTELIDPTGDWLRAQGNEFGSTTGRPRRCGWLDIVALRYACRVGGITELAITKLDVLSGLDEIKVCTEYLFEDKVFDTLGTLTTRVLKESDRRLQKFPGWKEDITGVRKIKDLPKNARKYLTFIEDTLGIPVIIVSVGPERDQVATH